MKRKGDLAVFCRCLLIFTAALLTELFVFNYRHWESLGNREIPAEALEGQIRFGSAYHQMEDHTYLVTDGGLEIELEGICESLKTACIKIQVLNSEEKDFPVILHQSVTDESHRLYYDLPERELWAAEDRSAYMTYHLYGKCSNLKIVPELSAGEQISFFISLNPVIPLFFSWERVFFLLFFTGLICLLKPSSRLHRILYLKISGKKRSILLFSIFLIHGVLFFWLTNVNPYFRQEIGENQKQYQKLAESLASGKLFIMEEPSETLKNMENPYDYAWRNQLMAEAGEWYQWDYAYYEGKYYVYFGVVPAALFYLPFYLLTGKHLSNHTVIFLLSLCFLSGVLGVIHELIRKWFPRVSLGAWFLVTELFLLGSNVIYMARRPDLYTVPILAGLSLGMLGLWCFLRGTRGAGFSCGYIAAGSLLTAGIAGCRPQLLIIIFPVMILLTEHMLFNSSDRGLHHAKGAIISFALPVISVALVLMYYNYSRFGSPFDFGANYNLTFNDMRRRGFHFDRIPLGVFAYLLQPVKLIQQFPFAEAVYFDSQYLGVTIQEATYGGIFMTHFFAWFALVPFLFRKYFKGCLQTVRHLASAMFLAALTVIVADTNMSGILMRYFSDFSGYLMLSAALSALMLLDRLQLNWMEDVHYGQREAFADLFRKGMIWILLICLLGTLTYQGMIFFLDTGEALKDLRPDLYAHVKYLTVFWI